MNKATELSGIEVSVSVLWQMNRYLSSINIDIRDAFSAAGADNDLLEHPDERLPFETYIAIEDAAAGIACDPCFGLHMGEFFEPGHWSILGYLLMNCRNLAEAFRKSYRYQKIIGNLIEGKISLGFKTVKAVLTTPKHAPELSRHCFESALSSSVRMLRIMTGKQLNPLEVGFIYPRPENTDEYKRVFCCPVRFNQNHTYIKVPLSIGNIPVLLHNESMRKHFEDYAENILSEIEGIDKTSRAVTKLVLGNLDSRNISIRKIAGELAMSVRTLQNRLKDEGTTFSILLEEIRKRLAKKYIMENHTIEDITYLLGFSNPSVFRKAFRKWMDMTPRDFRLKYLQKKGIT